MSDVMKAAQEFLDRRVPQIAALERECNLAYWNSTVTGSAEDEARYAEKRRELLMLYSDRQDFAAIQSWLNSAELTDPLLRRQLVILRNGYLPNQLPDETIRQMVDLEVQISGRFTAYRPLFEGKRVSDNTLHEVLAAETDSERRRAAWEASKEIGEQVAGTILKLVRLRNEAARTLGYENYYTMSLAMQELDESELFRLLDDLKRQTDEPFRRVKARMDRELAERFGVPADRLGPWHYRDPFFQEAPPLSGVELDRHFREADIEAICRRFFRDIGMDVSDILARSDLYEREGKNQHAYCIDVDRQGDVRVLANIRGTERWMSTMLHELGHAVYDKYHDPALPYLLRTCAHTLTTEAIAMLMGRLTQDPAWLMAYAGVPFDEAGRLRQPLADYTSLGMLIFVRWGLVMVYFERELYRNPDQDLNRLWWSLVEKLQYVRKPEGRDKPDWAAKIHIGTAPVYYQNYILGELAASQIDHALKQAIGRDTLAGPEAGKWLITRIFQPGARFHWNEMLELATGERLNPRHFIRQYVHGA